jgi:hypothetical protein
MNCNRPGRRALSAARAAMTVLALSSPALALAALGGDLATVIADQAHVSGKLATVRAYRYTIHEIAVPSGARVRQFASPEGTVFGVTWSGPTMPDLRQMLGPHFDQYVAAVAQRRVRGPVVVELPGLVVHATGHMRDFQGRAYLPEAVPPGVDVGEIQ